MQSLPIYLPGQSTDSSSTSPPSSTTSGRRARSRSPSIPCSSSARHYSPIAVPYPIVYSSPSLIDSARSSIYSIYSQHIPPPIIPLSSSPPPSQSNGTLSVEQQQLQLQLQLQQLQQQQQQHPPSPPLYSSPFNPLMLSRPLELPSMVSAPVSASSHSPPSSTSVTAAGGAGRPTDHHFSFASTSSSSFFPPSPSSLPLSSDPTQQQQQQQRHQFHHQQHQQQLDSTVLAMSNPTSTSTPQSHPLSIDVTPNLTNNNSNDNSNSISNSSVTSDINHTGVDMSTSIVDRDRDQEAALSPAAEGTVSRPRSVMDLAIDSAGGNPAGHRVRRNLMARFSDRWDNLPRNSRIILCLNGAMTLVKVSDQAAAVLHRNDRLKWHKYLGTCDQLDVVVHGL